MQIVVRLVAVKNRLYMLMVYEPKCRADMPLVRKFLDSFEATEPAGPLPPVAAADNFDGVMAYWDFDDGIKDNRALDLMPSRLHATLRGVQPGDGVRKKGVVFGGAGSFMDLGPSPLLDFKEKSGFAIACWFRTTVAEESTLLSFRNDNPQDKTGITVKVAARSLWAEVTMSDPKLGVRTKKLGGLTKSLKNRWAHFVLMRTPPHALHVYIDGIRRPIEVEEFDPCPGSITTKIRRVGEGFHGTLDEICIYNRPLLGPDLQALAGKVPNWVDSPLRVFRRE